MNKRIWMIGLLATVLIAGCTSAQSRTQAAMASATAADFTGPNASIPPTVTKFATKPKPLEIVESGYTVVQSGNMVVSGPYAECAFVLRNPNSDFGVEFPVVRITARDTAGAVLGTSDVTFKRWLMPGETAVLAQEADLRGQRPARIDIEAVDPGPKWRTASDARLKGLGFLKTANLKVDRTAPGIVFTGEVENPNPKAVDDFIVSVVLRDKSGRIVAGFSNTGMDLLVGSKQTFEVKPVRVVPTFTTAEAYAAGWGD